MSDTLKVVFGFSFVFVMTALGALAVFLFKREVGSKTSALINGFSAGIMLAASIWSLILPAIEQSESYGSFSFFLGTVILAEITYLASTCRLQLLRSYPELFAFLLAAAEILVFVPQFNQFGSINICICFTWIFSGRVLLSCIILLLIILALFARIITGGKKKDLCL